MCLVKLNAIVNGAGLILDMIGVILMFKKEDVTTYLFQEKEIKDINRTKNRKLNLGLWFLIIGFFLQLIALFL